MLLFGPPCLHVNKVITHKAAVPYLHAIARFDVLNQTKPIQVSSRYPVKQAQVKSALGCRVSRHPAAFLQKLIGTLQTRQVLFKGMAVLLSRQILQEQVTGWEEASRSVSWTKLTNDTKGYIVLSAWEDWSCWTYSRNSKVCVWAVVSCVLLVGNPRTAATIERPVWYAIFDDLAPVAMYCSYQLILPDFSGHNFVIFCVH